MKTVWLGVNTTFECNDNCKWCYNKTLPEEKKGTFTLEMSDKMLEVYKKHIEKYGYSKHNMLVFLGGEPLLYKNIVIETTMKFLEVEPRITFLDVYTNGKLLDEDFIKWTKQVRMGIHFSVGNSPIDFVKETANRIAKYRSYSTLTIPLTVENMLRLDELIDIVYETKLQMRLRHIYQGAVDKSYLEMYDSILPKSIQRILDKNYLPYPHFLYEMTSPYVPMSEGDKVIHSCGKNYFCMDPNGDVRTCLAQNNVIGNILDKDFDFFDNMEKNRLYTYAEQIDKIDECKKCEFKFVCGSGCPFTKKLAFGDIYHPSPFCKTFKKVFPLIFELKRRWKDSGRKVNF